MTMLRSTMLALCGLIVGTTAAAQPTPAMGQTLLKRLAEAVDGDRSGRTLWIVASTASPHPVAGVYGSEDSAGARSRELQAGAFAVFGPYRSDAVSVTPMPRLGCEHERHTSMMRSFWFARSDSIARPTPRPQGFAGICPDTGARPRRVSIVYEYPAGPPVTIDVSEAVDAIFFSVPAIDKFVVPYYLRTLGLERTAALRRELIGNLP